MVKRGKVFKSVYVQMDVNHRIALDLLKFHIGLSLKDIITEAVEDVCIKYSIVDDTKDIAGLSCRHFDINDV